MPIKKLESDFPATHVVHWPTGPYPACERHAKGLIILGNMLGSHIVTSPAGPGEQCQNCINESKITDDD